MKLERIPKIWKVIIIYVIAVLVICAVYFTVTYFHNKNQTVQVKDISKTVKNLPNSELTLLQQALTYVLEDNNDAKNVRPQDIAIRNGSYKQTKNGDTYKTSFMVDIPSLKQSYRLEDTYSTNSDKNKGDYRFMAYCPKRSELKYAYWKCKDRISDENRWPYHDEIMDLLPIDKSEYTNNYNNYVEYHITGEFNGDNLIVTITDITGGNEEKAKQDLTNKGIDLSNYKIVYQDESNTPH